MMRHIRNVDGDHVYAFSSGSAAERHNPALRRMVTAMAVAKTTAGTPERRQAERLAFDGGPGHDGERRYQTLLNSQARRWDGAPGCAACNTLWRLRLRGGVAVR